SDRALAEDDQAAREDVRTFHGDGDGHGFVAAPEVILRAKTDALAAVYIHRIVGDLARHFRDVIFHDRGRHRGHFAARYRSRGDQPCGVHRVHASAHAADDFIDAFEATDGHVELLADAGVGAGGVDRKLRRAGSVR